MSRGACGRVRKACADNWGRVGASTRGRESETRTHATLGLMSEEAGQVTLIFYKLGDRWWKEPFLNIVAAAAQMSSFTHVELAIGSDAGASGEMTNVTRVFNDDVGVASRPPLEPLSSRGYLCLCVVALTSPSAVSFSNLRSSPRAPDATHSECSAASLHNDETKKHTRHWPN